MKNVRSALEQNAALLKSRVSKYAWYGLAISILTIIIATLAVSYQMSGTISFQGIVDAQKNNIALLVLDLTPFLFMFWGQSVGSMMSYTASAMVIDQTESLRLEKSQLESRVEHDISHDFLTKLPNRKMFVKRLKRAISSMTGHEGKLAVVLVNINNFKEINTGLGANNADKILKQFSIRLSCSVSDVVTVGRFSGDEFALLFPHLDSMDEVKECIKKLQQALSIHFALDSFAIDVTARMGISVYPDHGDNHDLLLQFASIALYKARMLEKKFVIFSKGMEADQPTRLVLMSELKRAIELEQLDIYFQPKINLIDGTIYSLEALLRWSHPDFGMINASKFVPIAERTGMVKSLTDHVLNMVFSQAAQWHSEGTNLNIAVNLSAVDLTDPELPDRVKSALERYNMPAHKLTFEIIESFYLTDQRSAVEVIHKLANMGVRISIDDFGTGYASFMYLSDLAVSEIKIDRSFISTMLENKKKASIVEAMVHLGRELDITVVAEGVETVAQLEKLKKMGCEVAQGFYFAKALPAKEIQRLVNENHHYDLTDQPKTTGNEKVVNKTQIDIVDFPRKDDSKVSR
ncbi:putative bifunctional diguanylate cyclase/phosphodiesterase [Legionella sp. W05-934-2]|jgi:diguanylate cyclase (GGDEF)-like protein|uniref:putative bifunctional diguanylate cyclase/phosphodiesterase n=1 Tax=Legionella sp. W05-934-2 TaxID=1198649 RepID=UPI003462CFF1